MTDGATKRRAVITGVGIVSCCGMDKESFFQGICSEAPAGERRVFDFDPGEFFDPKEARRTDRFAHFAAAAGSQALADAGEIGTDPARSGVIYGSGVGGLE